MAEGIFHQKLQKLSSNYTNSEETLFELNKKVKVVLSQFIHFGFLLSINLNRTEMNIEYLRETYYG
jgi:hypothetical protein